MDINQEYKYYAGYTRHPNFTFGDNDFVKEMFSINTITKMSNDISNQLQGVDPQNRKIIVPDNTIFSVLSSTYQEYKPNVQDIFTRYNILTGPVDDYAYIIYQTISYIVSDVKSNLITDEQNSKLTVWTTVLGEGNDHGLRAHDKIKLRNKKPPSMLFHMNY